MGHESKEEREQLSNLEKNLDLENCSIDQLLEIASFYIEPFHQEEKAIMIFNKIIQREPEHDIAKIMLSYLYIHYEIVYEYLKQAQLILESIISKKHSNEKGAAYLLLAGLLEISEESSINYIEFLLEKSVEIEPNWSGNRYQLAWIYKKMGKLWNAKEQLKMAIQNSFSPDPILNNFMNVFETCITGRLGYKNFYDREYTRLISEA